LEKIDSHHISNRHKILEIPDVSELRSVQNEVTSLKTQLHAANTLIEKLNQGYHDQKQQTDEMKVEIESKSIDLAVLETKTATRVLHEENVVEEDQEKEAEYQRKFEEIVKETYAGLPTIYIGSIDTVKTIEKVKAKIARDMVSESFEIYSRNLKLEEFILQPHMLLETDQIPKIHGQNSYFDRSFLDKNSPNHYLYIRYVALLLKFHLAIVICHPIDSLLRWFLGKLVNHKLKPIIYFYFKIVSNSPFLYIL
jgi:hypothetical protein